MEKEEEEEGKTRGPLKLGQAGEVKLKQIGDHGMRDGGEKVELEVEVAKFGIMTSHAP